MRRQLKLLWSRLRQLSGDDAYERYLAHRAQRHPDEPVLDRKTFCREELQRRWSGISRCC